MEPDAAGGDATELIDEFPPADRHWAAAFRPGRVLAAVKDGGQGAGQLFGEPTEYARLRAKRSRPASRVARSEIPARGLKAVLPGLGLYIAIRDGWLANSWQGRQAASPAASVGGGFPMVHFARDEYQRTPNLVPLVPGLVLPITVSALPYPEPDAQSGVPAEVVPALAADDASAVRRHWWL